MHIFIDESGIFANPAERDHTLSCVGALVVPEAQCDEILQCLRDLKSEWTGSSSEIKGSSLSEDQIRSLCQKLLRFDVMWDFEVIDLGLHSASQLREFQDVQCQKLTANLTSDHHPNVVRGLTERAKRFRALSNSLFVQGFLLTELVHRVIQQSTLFYCERRPEELGAFHWSVDAKNARPTPYEELWNFTIVPFLESKSLTEPLLLMEGGNYDAMRRFYSSRVEWPTHIPVPDGEERVGPFFDPKKFMQQSFRLVDSSKSSGVQVADILCNATRRVLNGNMAGTLAEDIGRLTVTIAKDRSRIVYLTPNSDSPRLLDGIRLPYLDRLARMQAFSKDILRRDIQ
jgi:hypothetical protein